MEVETPTLSSAGNSDPNIQIMTVEGRTVRYLRTSPEYAMKRLLAAGLGDIYELGRVYRESESGPWHNPEFTLLEWYRPGWDYLDLAAEVISLIKHCGPEQFSNWPVQTVSYRELFTTGIGLDPFNCDESDLAACASERGINALGLTQQEWLDLLLSEVVQPQLEAESFTIVHDFPPATAALAKIRQGPCPVAERFEVFAGSVELANGYQELTDAAEQLARFERENHLRSIRGELVAPLDKALIDAIKHGLPECAGVAMGIDRLLMLMLGVEHIKMVLSFSSDRA
jgi:lysyl-tRNA synthetase class 2